MAPLTQYHGIVRTTTSSCHALQGEDYWRYRAELSSITLLDVPNAKVQLFGPIKGCCYHCSSPLLYNWEEMFAFRLKNWLGRANNIFPDAVTHATMGVYFCGTCIDNDNYYHPVHEFQIYQLDLSADNFVGIRTMDTLRGRFYPFRPTLARLSELQHPVMIPGPLGDQYEHLRATFWQGIHYLVHLEQMQFNQLPLPNTVAPSQTLTHGQHDVRLPEMSLDSAFEHSTAQLPQRQVFQPSASNNFLGRPDEHNTEPQAMGVSPSTQQSTEVYNTERPMPEHRNLAVLDQCSAASGSKSTSRATDSRSPLTASTRQTSQTSISRDLTPGSSRGKSRQTSSLAETAEEVEEEMDDEQPAKGERKQELARIRRAQDKIMQDVKTEQLVKALRDYGYVGTPGFEADADVRRWIMGDWKGMSERGIRDLEDVVKTLLYRWTKSYGAAQQPGVGSSSLVQGQHPPDVRQTSQAPSNAHTESAAPHPLYQQETHTDALKTAPSSQHPTADFFENGTGHMSLFEKTSGSTTGQSRNSAPLPDEQQNLLPAFPDLASEVGGIDTEYIRRQDAEKCQGIQPEASAAEACPSAEPGAIASSSRLAPLPANDADDANDAAEEEEVEEQDTQADSGKQPEGSVRHRSTSALRPARSTKVRTSEPTRRSSRVRGVDDK